MADDAIEILARGYHDAINKFWTKKFGGNNIPWDALPERAHPIAAWGENKADIRSWMTAAVAELKKAGFKIEKEKKDGL